DPRGSWIDEDRAGAAVSLSFGGQACTGPGAGAGAGDVSFVGRAFGAVAGAHCVPGGRFRIDGRGAVASFGIAPYRCGIWTRHSSAGDCREGDDLLVLERSEAGAVASRNGA